MQLRGSHELPGSLQWKCGRCHCCPVSGIAILYSSVLLCTAPIADTLQSRVSRSSNSIYAAQAYERKDPGTADAGKGEASPELLELRELFPDVDEVTLGNVISAAGQDKDCARQVKVPELFDLSAAHVHGTCPCERHFCSLGIGLASSHLCFMRRCWKKMACSLSRQPQSSPLLQQISSASRLQQRCMHLSSSLCYAVTATPIPSYAAEMPTMTPYTRYVNSPGFLLRGEQKHCYLSGRWPGLCLLFQKLCADIWGMGMHSVSVLSP